MRRGRDNGFLYDTDGTTLTGVNLGADYCSEHEWGIKGIQASFGIELADDKKLGLEKRTITTLPASPDLIFVKSKKSAVLYFRRVGYVSEGKSAADEQANVIKYDTDKGRAVSVRRSHAGDRVGREVLWRAHD